MLVHIVCAPGSNQYLSSRPASGKDDGLPAAAGCRNKAGLDKKFILCEQLL